MGRLWKPVMTIKLKVYLRTYVVGKRKPALNSWSPSQSGTPNCQYVYIVTVCGTICSVSRGENGGRTNLSEQPLFPSPCNAGDNCQPSISLPVIMEMKQLEE